MSGGAAMAQLRVYFGERDRVGDTPLDDLVVDACLRHGIEAAALLRGVEGFGPRHGLRTERVLSLSEDAPLVLVGAGDEAGVQALTEEVRGLGAHATAGPTTCLAGGVVGPAVGGAGDGEEQVEAMVWGSRSGPRAPHLGAVAAFKAHGVDAATVLLGVDGVLGGERQRARFVAGNTGVPAVTVAFGELAMIEAALGQVSGADLVTVAGVVPSCRIETESHHGTPGVRVMLVTSEVARGDAHPRYLEFVHELRRRGAAGATALRGVWGFRGAEGPHGGRVLALRRDVPMTVEAVDTPERAAEWEKLARSLAGEDDFVHSQPVSGTPVLE